MFFAYCALKHVSTKRSIKILQNFNRESFNITRRRTSPPPAFPAPFSTCALTRHVTRSPEFGARTFSSREKSIRAALALFARRSDGTVLSRSSIARARFPAAPVRCVPEITPEFSGDEDGGFRLCAGTFGAVIFHGIWRCE